MIHAIIDIRRAIFASKSKFTFTSVMCKMINTFAAILAWAKFRSGAIGNFGLAKFARISICTLALIRSNFVNTRGIVLATITITIIRVDLTSDTFKSQWTNTAETIKIKFVVFLIRKFQQKWNKKIKTYENLPASTT